MAPKGDPSAVTGDGAVRRVKSDKWVPKDLRDYSVPKMGEKYNGLLGGTFAHEPLWSRLNKLHLFLLGTTPLIAIYGAATWDFNWRTLLFAFVYYFFTGLGITAGESEGERREGVQTYASNAGAHDCAGRGSRGAPRHLVPDCSPIVHPSSSIPLRRVPPPLRPPRLQGDVARTHDPPSRGCRRRRGIRALVEPRPPRTPPVSPWEC
jgi:hypothetical protein